MKRKIWLFVAIIAILCVSLTYVISYAKNDATIYVNLGKANDSGIGYGIGDPIQINGKYIWELNQYNSNNITDKVTNPRNLYCIKADYGETWDNGRNPEGIVEYNLYYDLQKERQSLLDRLVDNGNSDLIKELLDPSGPVYRELLLLSATNNLVSILSASLIQPNLPKKLNLASNLLFSTFIQIASLLKSFGRISLR